MMVDLNVTESFPNVKKSLRFYLSLMRITSSGKRSFIRLKLFINVLRTSLSQNNLPNLGILSTLSEFIKSLDVQDVIRTFSNK